MSPTSSSSRRRACRLACALFALFVLQSVQFGSAAQIPQAQSASAASWRAEALRHAEQIQDKALAEDVFHDLAYVQARAGDLTAAAASAGQGTNLQKLVYARVFVAKQAAKRGDLDLCRQQLNLAFDAAVERQITKNPLVNNPLVPPYRQGDSFAHIIRACVELGLDDDARAVIQKLPAGNRAEATKDFDAAVATRKDPPPSDTSSQGIFQFPVDTRGERKERLESFEKRFNDQIAAGDAEAAAETIEATIGYLKTSPLPSQNSKFGQFDDEVLIASTRLQYVQTAGVFMKRGDRAAALRHMETARKAIFDLPETATLVKWFGQNLIVVSYIGIGELASANEATAKIESDFNRANAAARLAIAYVNAGDVPSAVDTTRHINRTGSHANPLGEVTAALVQHGDLDAARQMMRRLGNNAEDARAMREVGKAAITAGREPELRQWLTTIDSPAQRAYAAMGAAEQWARPKVE